MPTHNLKIRVSEQVLWRHKLQRRCSLEGDLEASIARAHTAPQGLKCSKALKSLWCDSRPSLKLKEMYASSAKCTVFMVESQIKLLQECVC